MGRRRTIVENMAQVGIATSAEDLRAMHAMGVVIHIFYAGGGDGLIEAWPTASAGELGIRTEEVIATDGAVIVAFCVRLVIFTCEGPFGPFHTAYVVNIL